MIRILMALAAMCLLCTGSASIAQRVPAYDAGDANAPPLPAVDLLPAPPVSLPELPPLPMAKPLSYEAYREGGFKAAQWAFRSNAAVAFDQLAARFALGSSDVSRLEKQLQDLNFELRRAEAALVGIDVPEGGDRTGMVSQRLARVSELRRQISELNTVLATRFPEYDELVRPRVYGFETVQALLRGDEALLLIMTVRDASYSFAVTRERVDWFRSPDMNQAALGKAVATLRSSLTSATGDFDRDLARNLYRQLIAPAEAVIGGKRVLMTIANGDLATLPLGLLIASDNGWMADRYVLSTLPSVSSLVALRCLLVAPQARASDCPVGSKGARQLPAPPTLTLFGIGAPVLLGPGMQRRGPPEISEAFAGGPLADPDAILRFSPLRFAESELTQLEARYGKQAKVFVGKQATEAEIKHNSDLPRARFVVLSTHGVLAGRLGRIGEPGLIFTPPPRGKASTDDDGYLTASEAAQLHLNADFVVLSACNTASAGTVTSGEGLSGLARAFFYAGARALLVSHWEVDDAATFQLVTTTFAELDRTGSRAEALQAAMRQLRRNPAFAHPRYWAAFTLVGAP